MTLDDWTLATTTDVDSEKYIRGQVTVDVSQMTEHQHLLVAHYDTKGRMQSNLHLFRQGGGFTWLERRNLRDAQFSELKKYAIFSKVMIASDDERVLLDIAGLQARAALVNLFSELSSSDKQVITEGASTILWFECPAEHFLLIIDTTTAGTLVEELCGEAELDNS